MHDAQREALQVLASFGKPWAFLCSFAQSAQSVVDSGSNFPSQASMLLARSFFTSVCWWCPCATVHVVVSTCFVRDQVTIRDRGDTMRPRVMCGIALSSVLSTEVRGIYQPWARIHACHRLKKATFGRPLFLL